MNRKKVLLALSGGVDSSVCIHLLQQQGYEVAGVVLQMSDAHEGTVAAAKESAASFSIPLYVKDMRCQFQQEVIQPFAAEYYQARTPNPCVICNPRVKFKALLDTADEEGFDYIATGHYAKVIHSDKKYWLAQSGNLQRDQSYMLYRLPQQVLSRLLLPLADMGKDKVRQVAAQLKLKCAQNPDSQEICFIPDNDYAGYLQQRFGQSKQGNFIGPDGQIVGRHKGILHYTVGQRKGLGVALGQPVFVTRIDGKSGDIYLGYSGQQFYQKLYLEQCVFADEALLQGSFEAGVKIRSVAQSAQARVTALSPQRAIVEFAQPQKAPTPGQSAVFYSQGIVLGGGIIKKCE